MQLLSYTSSYSCSLSESSPKCSCHDDACHRPKMNSRTFPSVDLSACGSGPCTSNVKSQSSESALHHQPSRSTQAAVQTNWIHTWLAEGAASMRCARTGCGCCCGRVITPVLPLVALSVSCKAADRMRTSSSRTPTINCRLTSSPFLCSARWAPYLFCRATTTCNVSALHLYSVSSSCFS